MENLSGTCVGGQGSIFDASALLEDRKGLSSTQIFAHVASETQAHIKPECQGRRERKHRGQNTTSGHLEVRKPSYTMQDMLVLAFVHCPVHLSHSSACYLVNAQNVKDYTALSLFLIP